MRMYKKLRNMGFGLIELIVAVAILSVVGGAVASVMVTSQRSYNSGSADTDLQYEAQLLSDQLQDLIIDTAIGISYQYNTEMVEAGKAKYEYTNTILTDENMEEGETAKTKQLWIWDEDCYYLLQWNEDEAAIYYYKYDGYTTDESSTTSAPELLAEYVTSFSVDLSEVSENRTVSYTIKFEKPGTGREYTTSHKIKLRNEALVNSTFDIIKQNVSTDNTNTGTGGYITVSPSEDIYLWPGGSYDSVLAKVYSSTGYITTQTVTWWFKGLTETTEDQQNNTSSEDGTYIDARGTLHVGSSERGTTDSNDTNTFIIYAKQGSLNSSSETENGSRGKSVVTVKVRTLTGISLAASSTSDTNTASASIGTTLTSLDSVSTAAALLTSKASIVTNATTLLTASASENNDEGLLVAGTDGTAATEINSGNVESYQTNGLEPGTSYTMTGYLTGNNINDIIENDTKDGVVNYSSLNTDLGGLTCTVTVSGDNNVSIDYDKIFSSYSFDSENGTVTFTLKENADLTSYSNLKLTMKYTSVKDGSVSSNEFIFPIVSNARADGYWYRNSDLTFSLNELFGVNANQDYYANRFYATVVFYTDDNFQNEMSNSSHYVYYFNSINNDPIGTVLDNYDITRKTGWQYKYDTNSTDASANRWILGFNNSSKTFRLILTNSISYGDVYYDANGINVTCKSAKITIKDSYTNNDYTYYAKIPTMKIEWSIDKKNFSDGNSPYYVNVYKNNNRKPGGGNFTYSKTIYYKLSDGWKNNDSFNSIENKPQFLNDLDISKFVCLVDGKSYRKIINDNGHTWYDNWLNYVKLELDDNNNCLKVYVEDNDAARELSGKTVILKYEGDKYEGCTSDMNIGYNTNQSGNTGCTSFLVLKFSDNEMSSSGNIYYGNRNEYNNLYCPSPVDLNALGYKETTEKQYIYTDTNQNERFEIITVNETFEITYQKKIRNNWTNEWIKDGSTVYLTYKSGDGIKEGWSKEDSYYLDQDKDSNVYVEGKDGGADSNDLYCPSPDALSSAGLNKNGTYYVYSEDNARFEVVVDGTKGDLSYKINYQAKSGRNNWMSKWMGDDNKIIYYTYKDNNQNNNYYKIVDGWSQDNCYYYVLYSYYSKNVEYNNSYQDLYFPTPDELKNLGLDVANAIYYLYMYNDNYRFEIKTILNNDNSMSYMFTKEELIAASYGESEWKNVWSNGSIDYLEYQYNDGWYHWTN